MGQSRIPIEFLILTFYSGWAKRGNGQSRIPVEMLGWFLMPGETWDP
jgi:hypothetical protein